MLENSKPTKSLVMLCTDHAVAVVGVDIGCDVAGGGICWIPEVTAAPVKGG